MSRFNRKFTVSVEGNIGAGKSTFIEYLRREPDLNTELIPEPLDKWTNIGGVNLLHRQYEDQKRWAFTFQSYAFLTLCDLHRRRVEPGVVKIMERSIHSARNTFLELLKKQGAVDECEFQILAESYRQLCGTGDTDVDLVVYMKTTPEVAYNRLRIRGRTEESSVPLDYLQKLHEQHEEWLIDGDLERRPSIMMVMDANKDQVEIVNEYRRVVKTIKSLLH